MKVFSLLIAIVLLSVTMAQAQCDKNIKITTSSTKGMDANGNVTSAVMSKKPSFFILVKSN